MTSGDISNLAQALAAGATVLSLLFVGYQIRQHTRALKATSHHAITDSFNAINALIISDQNTAGIWRRGWGGLENLGEDEAMSFSYMMLAYMRIFETLYYQYKTGTMEEQLYEAELNTLRWAFTNPGMRAWWIANPISFSAEYRAFIDALIRDVQEPAIVDEATSATITEAGPVSEERQP